MTFASWADEPNVLVKSVSSHQENGEPGQKALRIKQPAQIEEGEQAAFFAAQGKARTKRITQHGYGELVRSIGACTHPHGFHARAIPPSLPSNCSTMRRQYVKPASAEREGYDSRIKASVAEELRSLCPPNSPSNSEDRHDLDRRLRAIQLTEDCAGDMVGKVSERVLLREGKGLPRACRGATACGAVAMRKARADGLPVP